MILIKYAINLPNDVTVTTLLELAPVLSSRLRVFADKVENLEECDFARAYDQTTNTFTSIYRWKDQQAIDDFYRWADELLDPDTYQGSIDELNELIESVGGSITRTIETV